MAKRFTDSEKWAHPWFRKLKPEYKLFWLYVTDQCDNAGIWPVDIEAANFFIGTKLTEDGVLKVMGDKFVKIDDDKWFIPSFVLFQYGDKLIESVKAHASVIRILEKHKIDLNSYQTVKEGLPNPEGQEQGQEQGDKGGSAEGGEPNPATKIKPDEAPVVAPWGEATKWVELWAMWTEYKHKQHGFRFKTTASEQAGMKLLHNLARGSLETAEAIVQQAMGNGWQGLQPIKQQYNGNSNTKGSRQHRQDGWQGFVTNQGIHGQHDGSD